MSDDERFVLACSLVIGVGLWGLWLYRAMRPPAIICPMARRWPLLLAPPACALLLSLVLLSLAADDVRNAPEYVFMYLMMGAAWSAVALWLTPIMGVYPQQDVLERRNAAAGPALAGAMVGITLCFAGGNIGNGPGWWVVLFSAALATAGLYLLWGLVNFLARVSEIVTVHRDRAAGIRLGAMLLAAGLVLGRAVAGDWHSIEATVSDFLNLAWPALILGGLEVIASWVTKPTKSAAAAPVIPAGVLPGACYLLLASIYLSRIGWWPS